MKFVPVDPNQFPDLREGRRGRVSYPVLKSFLETGLAIAMLDRTGMQQSLQSLNSSLGAYIRSHNLPIRIANRSGQIYLIRTDLNEEGQVQAASPEQFRKPTEQQLGVHTLRVGPPANPPKPITPGEVEQRFAKEKGNVTK